MPHTRTVTVRGATNIGSVRSHNEDAILADAGRGLAVVADGMGGHASGEIASAIVVETFKQYSAATSLSGALLQAHYAIVEHASKYPESAGMGATAVAAAVDANHFEIAWVGDSRAYHWRRGTLRQISRDHSYLQALIQRGEITDAQARVHPQRNVVTQALGLNTPVPDVLQQEWQSGDRLLLCSDGLSDELEEADIVALLDNNSEVDIAISALVRAALRKGGRDNISVILIENSAEGAVPRAAAGHLAMAGAMAAGVLATIIWLLRR